MRLPFVSRDRYEETRDRLEREIKELKADKNRILDYLQIHSIGSPIFAEPGKPEDTRAAISAPLPSEDDEFKSALQEAKRHGCRSPRQQAEFISRWNEQRAADAQRRAAMERTQANSPHGVIDDFDAAIVEGQRAAQKEGTQ